MQDEKRVGVALLACAIALAGMLLADFLALHDIQRDYVSLDAVASAGGSAGPALPEWTAAEAEWTLVTISFYAKAGTVLLMMVLLSVRFLPAFIRRRAFPERRAED